MSVCIGRNYTSKWRVLTPLLVHLSELPTQGRTRYNRSYYSRSQSIMSESGSVPRTMLSGSALFFLSATIVNIGNYLFNLLLGRWLGPVAFADLSLIITLFLMLSFLTAGLQTPAARFAAIFAADKDASTTAAMRRGLQRAALVIGGVISVTFVAGAPVWKDFFSTASLWPFVIFGLFVPFYLLQGIDRGVLQGRLHFRWLALTYQSEMWSRLILGLLFVAIGWSVNGAVFGLGLSFIVTWLVASRVRRDLPPGATMQKDTHQQLLSYVGPVMIAQAGQILQKEIQLASGRELTS